MEYYMETDNHSSIITITWVVK